MKALRIVIPCLLSVILLAGCTPTPETDYPSSDTESLSERSTERQAESETETETEKEVVLPTSYKLQFDNTRTGIYNYCPTAMQMPDGTQYIYYCTNQQSHNIVDYIACRKGTPTGDGGVEWGEEQIVLSPSDGWDARHTCDPSVVAGSFTYGGERYGYLLAYLGCTSSDNQENKIGLAVSKSPEGPFVKVGSEPLIDFEKDSGFSGFQWGVGQPSLVNLDKAGRVMIFYTRGDKDATRVIAEEWELGNLDAPKRKSSVKLSESGLYNLDGGVDFLNNADFVYDAENGKYYISSDCHPNPADTPDYISSHFRITELSVKNGLENARHKTVKTIGASQTSFARNHNTALLRDQYGHLPSSDYLSVYYSVSDTGNDSLWSYRIYSCYVEII